MYQRILVGTDGSETAMRAVEAAARLALAHSAELIVAHALAERRTVDDPAAWRQTPEDQRWRLTPGCIAEAKIERAVRRAREVTGGSVAVRGEISAGAAAPVLLRLAGVTGADVIVVGNRDLRGFVRPWRRVGRVVSRHARCDVVIVDTIGRGRPACVG